MEIKTVEKIKFEPYEDKAWEVIYELCMNIQTLSTDEDIQFHAKRICESLDFLTDYLEE